MEMLAVSLCEVHVEENPPSHSGSWSAHPHGCHKSLTHPKESEYIPFRLVGVDLYLRVSHPVCSGAGVGAAVDLDKSPLQSTEVARPIYFSNLWTALLVFARFHSH